MDPRYDALLDEIVDNSIRQDSVTPSGKPNGYFSVVLDTLYYFTNGSRYKITATLDATYYLLQENDDKLLLETGDAILL